MPIRYMKLAEFTVDDTLAHGDEKYGANQWDHNEKSDVENRDNHLAAMGRHMKRYANGERIDESGKPTLGHIVARGMLALEYEERIKRGRCPDTCGEDVQCDRYHGHRKLNRTLHRCGTKEWL